jgi:hypothetical protein
MDEGFTLSSETSHWRVYLIHGKGLWLYES